MTIGEDEDVDHCKYVGNGTRCFDTDQRVFEYLCSKRQLSVCSVHLSVAVRVIFSCDTKIDILGEKALEKRVTSRTDLENNFSRALG